jgi:hypothetical protein
MPPVNSDFYPLGRLAANLRPERNGATAHVDGSSAQTQSINADLAPVANIRPDDAL